LLSSLRVEAFQIGSDILRECVRVIGERIEMMAEKARPNKVVVEFSISFEVKGKASIVPIFLTGETGGKTGLKITAEWARV
jgi:Trypsin-co-occurring domain 1